MQRLDAPDKQFEERHASENREAAQKSNQETSDYKEEEMKVMSDGLKTQIESIFE